MRVIKCDFDVPWEQRDEVKKLILQRARLLGIDKYIEEVILYRSTRGRVHAYVHLKVPVPEPFNVLIAYALGSDEMRFYYDMRRWLLHGRSVTALFCKKWRVHRAEDMPTERFLKLCTSLKNVGWSYY